VADTDWKAAERRLAEKLRGVRAPLSGRNGGGGTSGDYIPAVPGRDWLYAEFKLYGKAAILTLFADTRTKAKTEGRRPLVVMQQKKSRNVVAVLDFDLFVALLDKVDANGTESFIDRGKPVGKGKA